MKNLDKLNQKHLLNYLNELTNDEKENLINDIDSIDLELINKLYEHRNKQQLTDKNDFSPLKPTVLAKDESKRLFEQGLQMIKKGETAVVLMAGGQGTRLGHEGPKGTYDISLPSHKSLFNIQCDKLKRLYELTGTYIKWYIMTSEDNHTETVNHFRDNQYFGYSQNHITFFKQDRLPLVLDNGQVAMKSKFELNLAANGNGGVFVSLGNQGLLDQMELDGVRWVYLYGVDNILTKVADPTFLAFAENAGHDVASKAVDKTYPEEKVGVICYRNDHPDIVEYSELTDDMRYAKDKNEELLYRNGNILSHYFKLDFLKQCVNKELPYHLAHKKVNHYNGSLNIPTSPNGFKFELFLFDVFKYIKEMAVLTVSRDEEFAPIKNKAGKDSPEVAREQIFNLHKTWLNKAGYDTQEKLEVKSELTYQGENLEGRKLSEISLVDVK